MNDGNEQGGTPLREGYQPSEERGHQGALEKGYQPKVDVPVPQPPSVGSATVVPANNSGANSGAGNTEGKK